MRCQLSTHSLWDADDREEGERGGPDLWVRPGKVSGEGRVVPLGGDQAEDHHQRHDDEDEEVADGPDDLGRERAAELGDEERGDTEGDGAEEQADGALAHAGVVLGRLGPLWDTVVNLPAHPVGVVLDEREPRELQWKTQTMSTQINSFLTATRSD